MVNFDNLCIIEKWTIMYTPPTICWELRFCLWIRPSAFGFGPYPRQIWFIPLVPTYLIPFCNYILFFIWWANTNLCLSIKQIHLSLHLYLFISPTEIIITAAVVDWNNCKHAKGTHTKVESFKCSVNLHFLRGQFQWLQLYFYLLYHNPDKK